MIWHRLRLGFLLSIEIIVLLITFVPRLQFRITIHFDTVHIRNYFVLPITLESIYISSKYSIDRKNILTSRRHLGTKNSSVGL